MQRDMDTLTPLDARNSLLLDRKPTPLSDTTDSFSIKAGAMPEELKPLDSRDSDPERYAGFATSTTPEPPRLLSAGSAAYRPLTPSTPVDNLVTNAAPFGRADVVGRQPTLPNLSVNASGPYPSYRAAQPGFGSSVVYQQPGGGGYGQGDYGAARGYGGYGAAYGAPGRGY